MITHWVGIEGPNGAGKTHLTRALAARLGPRCQVLAELTDAEGEYVPAQVISALSCGGSFLRTGHPLTETFALKVREYELVTQMATPPPIVLEDRGIDTVALYQAAILLGPDTTDDDTWSLAQQIHATAAMWRPAPELTLLVLDDINPRPDPEIDNGRGDSGTVFLPARSRFRRPGAGRRATAAAPRDLPICQATKT